MLTLQRPPSWQRRALAGLLALLLVAAWFPIGWRCSLIVMSELYGLADRLGLLTGSASGAMQIKGRYISRPSDWIRWTVTITTHVIAWAPIWMISVFLARWIATGRLRRSFVRWRSGGCIASFGAGVFTVAILSAYLWIQQYDTIQNWFRAIGQALGGQYVHVQTRTYAPLGGPFHGEETLAFYLNWMYYWWPPVVISVGPFLLAWPVYGILARVCSRRQLERLCHECGYDLRATKAPRCPECGSAIEEVEESKS